MPDINLPEQPQITIDIGNPTIIVADGDVYDGSYDVTPKTTAQTLDTANKLLLYDVGVRAVPYYAVTNQTGGQTVNIAKNLED